MGRYYICLREVYSMTRRMAGMRARSLRRQEEPMKHMTHVCPMWLAVLAVLGLVVGSAAAQQKQPNIVVIMGDDIGIWNIGAYHRGMMSGKTPNLDKLASQGVLFTDYYAEASCTAGRAAFVTGELPIRTGLTTVGHPAWGDEVPE